MKDALNQLDDRDDFIEWLRSTDSSGLLNPWTRNEKNNIGATEDALNNLTKEETKELLLLHSIYTLEKIQSESIQSIDESLQTDGLEAEPEEATSTPTPTPDTIANNQTSESNEIKKQSDCLDNDIRFLNAAENNTDNNTLKTIENALINLGATLDKYKINIDPIAYNNQNDKISEKLKNKDKLLNESLLNEEAKYIVKHGVDNVIEQCKKHRKETQKKEQQDHLIKESRKNPHYQKIVESVTKQINEAGKGE